MDIYGWPRAARLEDEGKGVGVQYLNEFFSARKFYGDRIEAEECDANSDLSSLSASRGEREKGDGGNELKT